jgi:sugar phosphate isomerase/epimerase
LTDIHFDRRGFLGTAAAVAASAAFNAPPASAAESSPPRFRYCLNTGTIRGHNLRLEQEVDLIAAAGYDGIEPWIGEIETYVKNGGSLPDLRKRIADRGLAVESAIGFAQWVAADEAQRQAGLEQAKRDMDLVRQIGGTRIAAPPAGGTQAKIDLLQIAERYATLLAVGTEIGVTPQLEVWGFSENLARLGEAVCVAIESGHKDACLLPDVYHVYKGGSDFAGFKLVAGTSMHCFHMNDYPADPPRETIADKDRVYPGDGIAPLDEILQTIAATGFTGALSLELFNRDYWAQDAALVLRTGLEKMRASVAKAFA